MTTGDDVQDSIRCKADVDGRQMYIFALIFGRGARFQGVNLKMSQNMVLCMDNKRAFMNISSYVCCLGHLVYLKIN
jgi:hypothetical protein